MSDMRSTCDAGYTDFPEVDWSISDDIEMDVSLETAVIVSLFTDRRAHKDDVIDDRRGWWGDNELGSRLYLLQPGIMSQNTVNRAHDYCVEALDWLAKTEAVDRVEVLCGWVRDDGVIVNPKTGDVRQDLLGISVTLHKPGGESQTYRHQYVWEGQDAI